MKKLLDDVAEFHKAAGHPIENTLTVIGEERFTFRLSLIADEIEELREAYRNYLNKPSSFNFPPIAQEMVDLIYVLVGLALEMGIPLDRVWDEVQDANMRKVDPATGKIKYRDDGKVLKPEGWVGPDIEEAVFGG